jgi:hypothetical protein
LLGGEVGVVETGNVEAGREEEEEVVVVVEENEELTKEEKLDRGKMSIHSSAEEEPGNPDLLPSLGST